MRCFSRGEVLITGSSRRTAAATAAGGGWPPAGPEAAAEPTSERIQLPGPIDTRSALALFTAAGQLYVSVSRAAD